EEKKLVKGFAFLSEKPMIEVENIGEDQLSRLTEMQTQQNLPANTDRTIVCGKLEAEMAELPPEELRTFLADYKLTESGSARLIRTTYRLLGLISFFTVGEEECRAWTIASGTNAQRAAGAIHTDLQDHFIRAEVCHYDDFVKHGSHQALKEKGLLRLEGKDYIVKDGDIMEIRHSGYIAAVAHSLLFALVAATANIIGGLMVTRNNWAHRSLRYFIAVGSGFM